MQLYWAPNTRSLTALWMLEELAVPYQPVLVDIRAGAQDEAAFRAINPMGKVPALADGTARLAEAAAICTYLADRFPAAELAPAPDDPARGRYLQWLFFAPACIEPALTARRQGWAADPRTVGWGDQERVVAALEAALEPGPWLLGERFSAADVVVGSTVWFTLAFGMLEERPAFAAYRDRCSARPAFAAAHRINAEAATG